MPVATASGYDWRDVWTIINHLHDIMARIVLQAVGYDGGYQPTVVPSPVAPFPLDWVKPDTRPRTRVGVRSRKVGA